MQPDDVGAPFLPVVNSRRVREAGGDGAASGVGGEPVGVGVDEEAGTRGGGRGRDVSLVICLKDAVKVLECCL